MFGILKRLIKEKDGFHIDDNVELFKGAKTLTLLSLDGHDFCSFGMLPKETVQLKSDRRMDYSGPFGHSFIFKVSSASTFSNKCLHFDNFVYLDVGYMVKDGVRSTQFVKATFSYDTGNYFAIPSFGKKEFTYEYSIMSSDTFSIESYDTSWKLIAKSLFKIGK